MALKGTKVVMFLCDIQTAFRDKVSCFPAVVAAACRMTTSSDILQIPLIVTEQYPKGLGHTLDEIQIPASAKVFEKSKFSGLTEDVREHLKSLHGGETTDVVLYGLEAHICVQQTCLDLLKDGIAVHIIADATSSRMHADRMFAFETIRQAGGYVTTSESMLFALLGHSRHPKFKEIQKLIIEPLPDQGMFPKL